MPDFPPAEVFDRLLATMRDELDALDGGDAAQIEAATRRKIVALADARDAGSIPLERLIEARELNALAATRTNMLLAGVDRRLAALVAADDRGGALCYGRDGRLPLNK